MVNGYAGDAENDGNENDGPSKLQGVKLQDMKLQDMTNISLLLFLAIPVILAVLWKIWWNIYRFVSAVAAATC